MSNYLGFDWQHLGAGSCGRFAVRHALLCLGVPATERMITRALGVGRIVGLLGVSEVAIARAIGRFDCEAVEVEEDSPSRSRHLLNALLSDGCPCIVSVDNARHWAVIAGREGHDYCWIDSADDDLIGKCGWAELSDWMAMSKNVAEASYYAIALRPTRRSWVLQSLTRRFSTAWQHLAHDDLRKNWGRHLSELNDLFDATPGNGVTAAKFFASNSRRIVAGAIASGSQVDARKIDWHLTQLRTVAVTHRLCVPTRRVASAATALAVVLATNK